MKEHLTALCNILKYPSLFSAGILLSQLQFPYYQQSTKKNDYERRAEEKNNCTHAPFVKMLFPYWQILVLPSEKLNLGNLTLISKTSNYIFWCAEADKCFHLFNFLKHELALHHSHLERNVYWSRTFANNGNEWNTCLFSTTVQNALTGVPDLLTSYPHCVFTTVSCKEKS